MWTVVKSIERVVLAIPWALILLAALAAYTIVAHARGNLTAAEFVGAFTGGGLLAIGHGIHHIARNQSGRE
jgi:hypothetical protein